MPMTPSERTKAYVEKNHEKVKENRLKRYRENRDRILAKERDRLAELKKDPEAYGRYLEQKRERYRARRDAGKIPAYREIKAKWEREHREEIRAKTNGRRRQARLEAILAYGGKCDCCGQSRVEFLGIDHVNGGGVRHRKSLRSTDRREFCAYLKKLGYPAEYRVLCHNCNLSLGIYGYCPHQRENSGEAHL